MADSPRWCERCQTYGDHHTDRHPSGEQPGEEDLDTWLARALWEFNRQSLPGKGKGMEPPWPDRESGQCSRYYAQAERIINKLGQPSGEYQHGYAQGCNDTADSIRIAMRARRTPSTYYVHRVDVIVRKARVGWWVNGGWCPTGAVRDHRIRKLGGRPAPE